jgi:hypothetical protein
MGHSFIKRQLKLSPCISCPEERKLSNSLRIRLVISVLAIASLALPARPQTSRGAVVGTVTDISGAVIGRAEVLLAHKETGVIRSTVTNEVGIYRFDAVDLGTYTLKVTKPGFRPFLGTGVGVEANRATTLDAKLEVSGVQTAIEVNADAAELLTRDGPLRGGNLQGHEVSKLPLPDLDPISLARTLPGVSDPAGTMVFGGIMSPQWTFSVNGQRPRGNNFLLDGVDNNDPVFAGTAQSFNIPDAVQELSVQTSNFGVEFGRAGGGIFNVITRSGTNGYHGTIFWQYGSQRLNSVSNLDKLNGAPKSVFNQNIYGLTAGGPIRRDRTFFFGAFQQDTFRSTRQYPFVFPTADTVSRLRLLFPSNPRLDFYLSAVGDLRGVTKLFPLQLGPGRGVATFGTTVVGLPLSDQRRQWMLRLDHNFSQVHQSSARYIYDSGLTSPDRVFGIGVFFPGYITDFSWRNQNFLITDTYTIRPTWTNEFRFSYSRLPYSVSVSSRSVPPAPTLFKVSIPNIDTPGISPNLPQFRYSNNWLFQETQSRVVKRHTFRYGAEFLQQLSKQRGAGFIEGGQFRYTNTTNYSAFTNFLDDFSGPSGSIVRTFGDPVFYPNVFRQSYFFQNAWKARPSLTLTLGLRYENFGQPANSAFKYPAFAGFDPNQFLVPNKVNRDNRNFGPAFGVAWSPSSRSALMHRLLGDGKTVWRGGYQISYDTFFTQLLNFLSGDSPNVMRTQVVAPSGGRGMPNWFSQLPTVGRPSGPLDPQTFALDRNLRTPYTERWSFGLQRELASSILVDISYVGSESHKLFTREDANPRQPNNERLYPNLGIRQVVTSQGNAAYHALQLRLVRRLKQGFEIAGSYTWSRSIDSTSEAAPANISSNPGNLTSVPISSGGLKIDRGLSDYHRGQRLTIAYLWDIPGPRRGFAKQALGGWSVAGVTSFQSGAPFTVLNGFDRSNYGNRDDRPDIGNPNAPLNTRAVVTPASGPTSCSTGYRNPDTGACVSPTEVHFVEGRGFPNAATVGRNTLFTGGIKNWDMSLFKPFAIAERKHLEFRWEAFNAFNTPQFVNAPDRDVKGSLPGRFLNRDFTDSGIRTMRVQLKLIF